jgi:lipoprotein-anchoring transpeptidase ErfK/SrfK
VDISTAGVEVVESHRGLKVREGELRRTLTQVLTTADAVRDVKIPARFTKPKVTTKEVAKKYPSVIVVNRSSFTLTLYEKLKETKRYTVAIGAAGYDTPVGLYEIQNKAVNPVWNVPNSDWAGSLAGTVVPPGPSNPLKSRWMGIYNGAGIHGTDATYSLGSAASHGCIRMAIPDVEELYDQVDVGTPVYIG